MKSDNICEAFFYDLDQFNLEDVSETDCNQEYLEPDITLRVVEDLENTKTAIVTNIPGKDSICDFKKLSHSESNSVSKNVCNENPYDFEKGNELSNSENILYNNSFSKQGNLQTNDKNVCNLEDVLETDFNQEYLEPEITSVVAEDLENSKTAILTNIPGKDFTCDFEKLSHSQKSSVSKKICSKYSYEFAKGNELSNSENILFNNSFLKEGNLQTNDKNMLSMHQDASDLFQNVEKNKPETETSPLSVKISNFLEKLSKKDFHGHTEVSIASLENSKFMSSVPISCNSSIVYIDNISKTPNRLEPQKRHTPVMKKKCNKSFDFLNSYMSVKNNVTLSSRPTKIQEEKNINYHEHGLKAEESLNSVTHVVSSKELFSSLEDIVIELPEEFVEAFHLYENAATPLIKKLFERDEFQFPLEVTLADILPDQTRFLLNQEMKFSRDANINPVLGGVAGSYYIQLLTLHGILKSLYALTHFSPEIALCCLLEFQKTHALLLQNCYEDLKMNLSNVVKMLNKMYPIHPKVIRLCEFLKEKFLFCKKHKCIFKALIITNHHLSFLYASLCTEIKMEDCNISIDLIPENVVLNQNCLNFRNTENYIYVVNSNSVSKTMPWKDISLVLEYENCNTNWREICCKNSIPHAFVKVSSPFLKLIKDLKENTTTDVQNSTLNLKPMPLVVSEVITSNYEILKFLDSREDVLLCERNYLKMLPHMYFADILIDQKAAAIVLEKTLFATIDYMNFSFEKIIFLTLKYELIWIIVHETEIAMNIDSTVLTEIQANFFQFHVEVLKLKGKRTLFKTMFLFVRTIGDMTAVISEILTFRLRKRADFITEGSIFSRDITKEEIFLASFPSLNPFVIDIILHSHSLAELMCMTLSTLSIEYPSIPERFFSRFHYTVNMDIDTLDELFQKSTDDVEELNGSSSESKVFEYSPKEPEVELPESEEEYENHSSTSPDKQANYFEKTLQEIDQDYLACKYSPSFISNMNIDSSISDEEMNDVHLHSEMANQFSYPSPFFKRMKTEHKNTVVVRPMLETLDMSQSGAENKLLDQNNYIHQNESKEDKFLCCSPKMRDVSQNNRFIGRKKNFHKNSHSINKFSDISKLKYIRKNYKPSPRKTLSEQNSLTFSPNTMFSQESKNLSNTMRINKGLCSKTVCKLDVIQNLTAERKSDLETQKVSPIICKSPDGFCNSKELMEFEDQKYKQTTPKKVLNVSFHNNLITDCNWLSQTNVRLTPCEGKRLQYEKIPGHKGQTRLVFQ